METCYIVTPPPRSRGWYQWYPGTGIRDFAQIAPTVPPSTLDYTPPLGVLLPCAQQNAVHAVPGEWVVMAGW